MVHLDHLRERFHIDGFAHAPAMLTTQQMQALEAAHGKLIGKAGRILSQIKRTEQTFPDYYRASGEQLIVVPESSDPTQVCRLEYLCGANLTMRQFVSRTILPTIHALTGEPCTLFKDKCNEKSPGGGGFAPHQDFAAYQVFPARSYTTAMVALDDATLENGCLYFAEGYKGLADEHPDFVEQEFHGFPLFHHARGGHDNGCIVREIVGALRWVPLPVRRGDVVIFDAFVPHYSNPNHSDAQRRILFFTFNEVRYGDYYDAYYQSKRERYDDPSFHVATPTEHASS